jgi:uncharacterized protein (DUF934 family)
MPLIKDGAWIADPFETVADDAALPAGGAIVSLARFERDRAALLARNVPLGVRLSADQSPERLGEDLHHLSVVVLEFPAFRDGRAFSWARMLRERLRYKGEVRATGDFLYDQLAFLLRVGFDAFEVRENFTPDMFARAQAEISHVYQPSADGQPTIPSLRAAAHRARS